MQKLVETGETKLISINVKKNGLIYLLITSIVNYKQNNIEELYIVSKKDI